MNDSFHGPHDRRHNSGNIVTANLMQFQVDTFLRYFGKPRPQISLHPLEWFNLIKEQEQQKYDHQGLKYGVGPNRLFKSAISGGWMWWWFAREFILIHFTVDLRDYSPSQFWAGFANSNLLMDLPRVSVWQ